MNIMLQIRWLRNTYLPAEAIEERTERVKDTHGHIFVKHDLFNHDPALGNPNPNNIYSQDGIAEAFAEFAKKEGLSFFQQAHPLNLSTKLNTGL